MLERVKDFRYEEIKNWKPIVSLRESYRRENSLRTLTLIPICILAVLVGYAFLSGWIQFSGESTQADSQNLSGSNSKIAATQANLPPQPQTNPNLQSGSQTLSSAKPTSVSLAKTTNSGVSLIDSTGNSSRNQQVSAYYTQPSLQIGVCDTEQLAMNAIDQVLRMSENKYTSEFTADRQQMMQALGELSAVEVGLVKKIFEQKKRIAENQLKMQANDLLLQYEEQIKPYIIAVSQEQGLDLIVPRRSVLAYSQSIDVTQLVRQKIEQANLNAAGIQDNTAQSINLNQFNR